MLHVGIDPTPGRSQVTRHAGDRAGRRSQTAARSGAATRRQLVCDYYLRSDFWNIRSERSDAAFAAFAAAFASAAAC